MIGPNRLTPRLTLTTTPNHTMSVTLDMLQSSPSGGLEPPLLVIAEAFAEFHMVDSIFTGTNLALKTTNTIAKEFMESKEKTWK